MSTTIPQIPDNAPFTEEQRIWLNGMLAGMIAALTPPSSMEAKASHRIAVLYASQSGTAEGLGAQTRQRTQGARACPCCVNAGRLHACGSRSGEVCRLHRQHLR